MGTNHQPLFKVLHRLPLHLIPLVSVTASQTFLRSIASFASDCCFTLPNNLLLQEVKPVYNVSHLAPLHSLLQTWVIKHFFHCWRGHIASFASYWCSTLLNNLLLQKVKPVHNVPRLFVNLQLENTLFRHYKETYRPLREVDTVGMSPRLLEAAVTATSLQSQLARRRPEIYIWGRQSTIASIILVMVKFSESPVGGEGMVTRDAVKERRRRSVYSDKRTGNNN